MFLFKVSYFEGSFSSSWLPGLIIIPEPPKDVLMTFYGFQFSMTADVSIILWLTTFGLRPPCVSRSQ